MYVNICPSVIHVDRYRSRFPKDKSFLFVVTHTYMLYTLIKIQKTAKSLSLRGFKIFYYLIKFYEEISRAKQIVNDFIIYIHDPQLFLIIQSSYV
jgi:hypothetical protein